MSLYASITTHPPLNKLTVLPSPSSSSSSTPPTTLPITALLTTAADRPRYPFIVHCHYHITPTSHNASHEDAALPPPSTWPAIALTESPTPTITAEEANAGTARREQVRNVNFISTEGETRGEKRRVFRGEIDLSAELGSGGGGGGGGGRVRFAVRYLIDEYAGWRWEEVRGGVGVGDVLVRAVGGEGGGEEEEDELRRVFGLESSTAWVVNALEAEEGGGRGNGGGGVFELESREHIPEIKDGTDAYGGELAELTLGRVKEQVRYMSLVRLEPYWLGVQHGMTSREWEGVFEQSMDGVLVAFLLKSGRVAVVLAVNGNEDVYTVIRSSADGEVMVAARNDSGAAEKWRVLVAVGDGVEEGTAKVMDAATARVMNAPKMQKLLTGAEEVLKSTIMAKESWFDGLAYCTWNGLDMHRCDEKAVLEGIQTLEESGVKIETFLLDDCWQSTKQPDGSEKFGAIDAGWDKFEPNKNFPRGLKPLIEEVKSKHKGIKSFGIWHALFGYWGGIAEGGWIDKNYKTRRVTTKFIGNVPGKMLIVDPKDVDRFYDDLYGWLKHEGIDFVKTDVQHMLSMLEDRKDREEVPAAYQRAWTLAVMKHFGGKAISCMSQSPQTIFHSLLQDRTPKVMHRNSDDFYPDIVGSNPWHIYVNAFNALIDRHLNVVPDWDMYQTGHPWSGYHTAARCLSGGPVLITDIPGKHDIKLVEEMTATNLDGTLIALRPKPAAAMDHWERYADGNLCKIGTSTDTSGSAAGLLGVFNIVEGTVSELIGLNAFPAVESDEVLVRSHRTGQIFGPLKRSEGALLNVTVAPRGFDILTAYPVHSSALVVLGLDGKMSGAAAVIEQDVKDDQIKVTLKALGKLAVWSTSSCAKVKAVHAKGKAVSNKYVSSKDHRTGQIFEIDLMSFWKDESLWCDDEVVEVTIELA